MPINRSNYPPDWEDISRQVKEEAGWCCETCGAKHGETIYREKRTARWTPDIAVAEVTYRRYYESIVQIGVAHLGIDKPDGSPGSKFDTMDCRRDNLRALCRRCHLHFDLPENIVQRRRTRLRKRRQRAEAHGQLRLWKDGN
jgi:hypothetical protein